MIVKNTRRKLNAVCLPTPIFFNLLGGSRAIPGPTGNLVIIANPRVQTEEILMEDLRSVYLGIKTTLKNGIRVKPVLEKDGPAHSNFLKTYMGKSDVALRTNYRSLLFAGQWSMPTTLHSDAEVVDYISRTPAAIGYTQANAVTESVKVLRLK